MMLSLVYSRLNLFYPHTHTHTHVIKSSAKSSGRRFVRASSCCADVKMRINRLGDVLTNLFRQTNDAVSDARRSIRFSTEFVCKFFEMLRHDSWNDFRSPYAVPVDKTVWIMNADSSGACNWIDRQSTSWLIDVKRMRRSCFLGTSPRRFAIECSTSSVQNTLNKWY